MSSPTVVTRHRLIHGCFEELYPERAWRRTASLNDANRRTIEVALSAVGFELGPSIRTELQREFSAFRAARVRRMLDEAFRRRMGRDLALGDDVEDIAAVWILTYGRHKMVVAPLVEVCRAYRVTRSRGRNAPEVLSARSISAIFYNRWSSGAKPRDPGRRRSPPRGSATQTTRRTPPPPPPPPPSSEQHHHRPAPRDIPSLSRRPSLQTLRNLFKLPRRYTQQELMRARRTLMGLYHPDHFHGCAPEVIEQVTELAKRINDGHARLLEGARAAA